MRLAQEHSSASCELKSKELAIPPMSQPCPPLAERPEWMFFTTDQPKSKKIGLILKEERTGTALQTYKYRPYDTRDTEYQQVGTRRYNIICGFS
jgi:hypothetical protein